MIKEIDEKNAMAQAGDRELNMLKETFPQCFDKDGRFDKEAFLSALPDGLEVTDETSGFNWLGKNYACMLYNMDSTTFGLQDLVADFLFVGDLNYLCTIQKP